MNVKRVEKGIEKNKIGLIWDSIDVEERKLHIYILSKYLELFMPEKNWLSKRERDFLVASAIIEQSGVRLYSPEAVQILSENFGFKTKFASKKQRGALLKKNWLYKAGRTFKTTPNLNPDNFANRTEFRLYLTKTEKVGEANSLE